MRNIFSILNLIIVLAIPGIARAEVSDSFAGASTIAINSYNTFTTTGSDREPGEPGFIGYGSMWFRYVAPTRGIVRLNTTSPHYTYFHVLRGTSIDKLHLVEEGVSKISGKVTFPAEAGMEFLIAVSTDSPIAEDIGFSIQQDPWPYGAGTVVVPPMPTSVEPPDRDLGDNNTVIPSSSSSVTVLAYNRNTGWLHPISRTCGHNLLWYRWTAPSTGIARISTPASPALGFEHALSVFHGDHSLNLVTGGIDTSGPSVSYSFPVVKGLKYRICFGSSSGEWNDSGSVIFTIRTDAWPYGSGTVIAPRMPTGGTPPNDQFEGATKLPSKPGEKFVIVDYNSSATWDDDEGLWYQWTAQESAYVCFQTPSRPVLGYGHILSAWVGSSLGELKQVASSRTGIINQSPPKTPNFARIGFFATKGKTYHLTLSSLSFGGDRVIISYQSGPQVNTTAPKVTFRRDKDDQAFIRWSEVGLVVGQDPEGISRVQLKVNGRLVYNEDYTYRSFPVFISSAKKKRVVLEARAQDRFGRWGPYAKRVVMAQRISGTFAKRWFRFPPSIVSEPPSRRRNERRPRIKS